jgi:TonB family protein
MVFPAGLYDTEGRHLSGVLGRDVLADSLVFGFDRDQGIATLSTVKAFTPPADATKITYQSVSSRSSAMTSNVDPTAAAGRSGAALPDVAPVPRRLATAQIGDGQFAMHLDLGAAASQLPEASWSKAKLVPSEVQLRLVDEAATARRVTTAGVAADVTLGAAKTFHVTFVPFIEKRFATEGVDGALGLNFFRPYAVYASWDSKAFYLKSRGDAAATTVARLGRWGADLPSCPHPGCVSVDLTASEAGVALHVTRDPQAANHALEVFFGVTPAAGKAAAPLVIALPGSADQLTAPVPAEYAGATLTVLDASPFPRDCPGAGGCVVQLGAADAADADVAEPAARQASSVKTVALDKLHRLTGEPAIPPGDDVRQAAGKKPLGVLIVKVCLTVEGKVDSTKIVKSSGVAAYDAQVQRTIQATWTFEPDAPEGKPAPVCTQITFLTH